MLYYNAVKNWGAGPEHEQADVLQVALEDHGELNNNNILASGSHTPPYQTVRHLYVRH
jgi:hypothetical protein